MRCLISPSGERSHGMSSALITFGRVAYSLRKSAERWISSARQLQVLVPDRACCLSSMALMAKLPLLVEHDRDHAQLVEHDLFRKPASTPGQAGRRLFRDHAQISVGGE